MKQAGKAAARPIGTPGNRRRLFGAAVLSIVTITGVIDASAPSVAATEPVGLVSVEPARVVETRSGPGLDTIDGVLEGIGASAAGSVLTVPVLGRGGVPASGVAAVMLNVTAVGPSASGFLTVFPCGTSRPTASNVNYLPGQVVPNAVLAKVGQGGAICVFTLATTHLVIDVNGYATTGSGTNPVEPARVVETRSGPGLDTIDGVLEGIGASAAGSVLTVPVLGRGGVPASGVAAVMLNVTAVGPSASGFLTVFPCGTSRPTASNVNYLPGQVVPNAVLAKVGQGGAICVFTLATTHLVIDVNGYATTGSGTNPVEPARVVETRSGPGLDTIDGVLDGIGASAAGSVLTVPVLGRGGVPASGVAAVMLNVTAVGPSASGFLTVFPCGTSRPTASNVNYLPGQVVPNAVLAKVGQGGAICVFTLATTHLVIDVNAWFAAPAGTVDPGAPSGLDPAFGSNGTATRAYDAPVGVTVVGAAKAPNGDTIIALEPAHTKWGCCLANVGGWSLVRITAGGQLRSTFGTGGVVRPAAAAKPGTLGSFIPVGVGVDGDGRTVIAGRIPVSRDKSANTVLRRTSTGAADAGFGASGRVDLPAPTLCNTQYTAPWISDVLVQPDAKVVVVGSCSTFEGFVVVAWRLTTSGALDPTFHANGMMTKVLPSSVAACCGVHVHRIAGGKLVIGTGSNVAAILRVRSDGRMDTTYSGDGMALVGSSGDGGASLIVAADDGRVVIDRRNGEVTRLNADGKVDNGFGRPSFALPDPCFYPELLGLTAADDRLVGLVQCKQGAALSMLDGAGALDASFGTRSTTVRSSSSVDFYLARDMLIRDGAGFLVVGAHRELGLLVERRLANGGVDTSWGNGGSLRVGIRHRLFSVLETPAAYDSKGRVVTAALINDRDMSDEGMIAISRTLANGDLDRSFGTRGTRYIEAGRFRPNDDETTAALSLVVNADDSVSIVGSWVNEDFASFESGLFVARITAGGELDTAVVPGGRRVVAVPGVDASDIDQYRVGNAVAGPGGTLLVPLAPWGVNGLDPSVVRLLPSGEVDTSFGDAGLKRIASHNVDSGNPRVRLAAMPDGGVVVSWWQWRASFDGYANLVVARLGPSGEIEAGFGSGGTFRRKVPEYSAAFVTTTPSGKVLIAWSVPLHPKDDRDATATHRVLRLTSAGAPDLTFGTEGLTTVDRPSNSISDRVLGLGASGERPLLLVLASPGGHDEQRLVRLTTAGAVDRSFGASGTVTVGRDPGYGGIDYVVLAGPGMPTSIVHRSVSRDSSDPERVVLHRVLS